MKHIHVAALVGLLALASCSSTGGASQLGLVGRVVVGLPPDHTTTVVATPSVIAWDGDAFLAVGYLGGQAGVFLRDTGGWVWPPREFEEGKAYVRVRSTGFTWEGEWGDPLPLQAKFAFRPGEAEVWGFTFVEVAP
jgi:hypothetical protein